MGTAAASLHLTQPAVTRAMQGLEKEVATRLIERRRSGSFLTSDGALFAQRTHRFFAQIESALCAAIGSGPETGMAERLALKIGDVHIRSLIAISKAGSFRGAARALAIAEPTLHRPARDLERLMKTPLFRRTAEGIGLSPAGVELARQFALAYVEIAAGLEELASRRGAAERTITIGTLPLAPKRPLAAATETLLARNGDARIVVHEASYDELVTALRSGAVDLIFGALRDPPPFADLDEERLRDDPYRIVCRRDHPLLQQRDPVPSDLRNYHWVFPTGEMPRRAVLDRLIADWDLARRVEIETNSLGTVIADLAASDHLSLLPRGSIEADDPRGLLATLPLQVPHPRRTVGLTTRHGWLPTAFQAAFLALLRKTMP